MHAWIWAAIGFLMATSQASAAPFITGFATNLPGTQGDDAFELFNPTAAPIALDLVRVTDLEGTVTWPAGAVLPAGERVVVAVNASAYEAATRRGPDYSSSGGPSDQVTLEGAFRLSQGRDELQVWVGDELVDVAVWGTSPYAGTGWDGPTIDVAGTSHLRWYARSHDVDTNSSSDWREPHRRFMGWLEPVYASVTVAGQTLAYVAPDQSRKAFSDLLERTQKSLDVNVYDWRDVGLAQDVIARMREVPAMSVRVLVQENPVGLDQQERLVRDGILLALDEAGAEVRLFANDRYAFNHAKYVVADKRAVLIQTENFVASAMPTNAVDGNRGLGVIIDSPDLAQTLTSVFEYDFALDPYGARELNAEQRAAPPLPVAASQSPAPKHESVVAAGVEAELVVGPETHLSTNDVILRALARAEESVQIWQLDVQQDWRDRRAALWPNAYLEAALDAGRRGAEVRILLDGHFLDGNGRDNAATARWVAEMKNNTNVHVRLVVGDQAGIVHAKALVVDDKWTVLGSTNWNLNSVTQNREIDILLASPEVGSYYRSVFDDDWSQGASIEDLRQPTRTVASLPAIATVIMLAFVAALPPRRRDHPSGTA